jgi:hypothetical protein
MEVPMFDEQVRRTVNEMAKSLGVEPAALLAIAEVESGGRPFAMVQGRREPLIRFEGHYFDQRLTGEKRRRARAAGLASPVAGAVANPPAQAERWALLQRAADIDHAAAHESVSWGLGQVMGAHWKWLDFDTVDALAAEARGGLEGQIRLMARYIAKAGLCDAIRKRNWEAFARAYNGPAYARHGYHTKIAAAYERYRDEAPAADATRAVPPAPLPRTPAIVSTEHIRDLQRMLSATGYPVKVDGVDGPLTKKAVRRFQKDHGLVADGIAGPKTLAALRKAMPLGEGGGIWKRIVGFLKRLVGLGP